MVRSSSAELILRRCHSQPLDLPPSPSALILDSSAQVELDAPKRDPLSMFLWNSLEPYMARESSEKSTNCSPLVSSSVSLLTA